MKRPDSFDFAMDFLGSPESEELIRYVEKLELKISKYRKVLNYCIGQIYSSGKLKYIGAMMRAIDT